MKRTDLRKRPADDSPSLGRIPKGTIVTLTGERQNGFVAVEVELEEGSIEGWLPKDTLNKAARNELPPVEGDEASEKLPVRRRSDVEPDEEDEEVLIRPRSRMRVPKDEGLLLRRDPLFIYGLQVTGGLSMQVPDYTTEEYMGPAFGAGAHAGYFLTRNLPVRAEVGYLLQSSSDSTGNSISIGFLEFAGSVSYMIDEFEIFGGAQYLYGLSFGEAAPPALNKLIVGPEDFSSIYIMGGLGYRIPVSDVTSLNLRGRYSFSFLRAPIGFSLFTLQAFLEFRG